VVLPGAAIWASLDLVKHRQRERKEQRMTGRHVVRVAMWSGPRNISTAMMRSFENRRDCVVWDEPYYAAYLARTGLDHPMREEIVAAGITDPAEVARRLLDVPAEPDKPNASVFYQKHMTHHMLDGFGRDWIDRVANAFLIREPERVLASYDQKREGATLADIGFPFQLEIFERVADRLGKAPPVLLSNDVLADPRGMLGALCAAVSIPFDERMLAWPAGPRASDGVWASHWYNAVWQSTGFAGPDRKQVALSPALARVADAARPYFERLLAFRMAPPGGGRAPRDA
jgi:hypothetical protein